MAAEKTDMSRQDYFVSKWNRDVYAAGKNSVFEVIDQHLSAPPKRILDIGCGFAQVSELFQKKYGTELYLLDGDSDSNSATATRKNKYGSVDNFQFYLPEATLKSHWNDRDMSYTFVDARNPLIDPTVKFDLVYSLLSCGFHYPVLTYRDFIRKHTDQDSIIIMDFRRKIIAREQESAGFNIVHRLEGSDDSKKNKLQIKFRD